MRKIEQPPPEIPFPLRGDMHFHLVGVGGSGMSAIAWLLLERGFTVSGSDMESNEMTAALRSAGATIYRGHESAHVAGADALVISSAIPADNVEVRAAREAELPVLKRAEFLGLLMVGQVGVAVAGTHGKTTTTGLIAHLLLAAGRDPSVVVGGLLPGLGRNGRLGQGDLFVVEADEYDHMFLGLRPRIAVITNIEHDHPDIYPTPVDYSAAFARFVDRLPEGGTLIACRDDEGVRRLLDEIVHEELELLTFGLEEGIGAPDFLAVDLQPNQAGGSDFVVLFRGELLGLARIRIPGTHNVLNALAAIAAGWSVGCTFFEMQQGLAEFGGADRRFQIVGEVEDIVVIDDYAHHPTEIRATLAAARQRYPGRRLWTIWQPHTYSRTKLLFDEFASSFRAADRVIVLDIYQSREQDTLGMDSELVVAHMEHDDVHYIGDRREAAAYVLDRIRPGDVILTLGAGDGDEVGQWILNGLRK